MMKRLRAPLAVMAVAASMALVPWVADAAVKPLPARTMAALAAFPGAVGFGAMATGGRGGPVYHVTNLNDAGAGSLRDAVSQGPRIVVFDVAGYITLKTALSVKSNITIAGQTAPGMGVTVRGAQVSFSGSTNVIVRYLRFRHGLEGAKKDAITMYDGHNQIFDHLSVSWGRDENFSINASTGITVQNSIISEGLEGHSCGGLIQSDGVTVYQTLYAHNKTRNPKVKGKMQFVNNVVYNWGSDAFILGDSAGLSEANVLGNYFVKGLSTGGGSPFTRGNTNFHIYETGNVIDSNRNTQLDGVPTVRAQLGTVTIAPRPYAFPAVPVAPAASAHAAIVAHAGASLRRDAVDTRVINDLTRSTGKLISDPATVGGWEPLPGGAAPRDTDRDGMPDAWETAQGLNPASAADGSRIAPDGYSNIERYINGLVR
ncbi:MAG TPA: hypothetical protein VK453_23570 [Micromonosporaceae bacterium]|nr:hypothetical protein [Micromonosporaceae bacterium]